MAAEVGRGGKGLAATSASRTLRTTHYALRTTHITPPLPLPPSLCQTRTVRLATVIPTLNAETQLVPLLDDLAGGPEAGMGVVVSDGGSEDGTLRAALRRGAVLAVGSAGRGQQLARGARLALEHLADGGWLLFLHADTRLPSHWREVVEAHMASSDTPAYFAFGGEGPPLAVHWLRLMVRLRELAWKLPYGDQGLLIPARLYREVGGFHALELFEDVDMVTRLARRGRLRRLPARIHTDIRAYHRDGVLRRGARNLGLLAAYRRGVPVDELKARYARVHGAGEAVPGVGRDSDPHLLVPKSKTPH